MLKCILEIFLCLIFTMVFIDLTSGIIMMLSLLADISRKDLVSLQSIVMIWKIKYLLLLLMLMLFMKSIGAILETQSWSTNTPYCNTVTSNNWSSMINSSSSKVQQMQQVMKSQRDSKLTILGYSQEEQELTLMHMQLLIITVAKSN